MHGHGHAQNAMHFNNSEPCRANKTECMHSRTRTTKYTILIYVAQLLVTSGSPTHHSPHASPPKESLVGTCCASSHMCLRDLKYADPAIPAIRGAAQCSFNTRYPHIPYSMHITPRLRMHTLEPPSITHHPLPAARHPHACTSTGYRPILTHAFPDIPGPCLLHITPV